MSNLFEYMGFSNGQAYNSQQQLPPPPQFQPHYLNAPYNQPRPLREQLPYVKELNYIKDQLKKREAIIRSSTRNPNFKLTIKVKFGNISGETFVFGDINDIKRCKKIENNTQFVLLVGYDEMCYRWNIPKLYYRSEELIDKIWIPISLHVLRFNKFEYRIYYLIVDTDAVVMAIDDPQNQQDNDYAVFGRLARDSDESINNVIQDENHVLFWAG